MMMKRLLLVISLLGLFMIVGCSEESQPPTPNVHRPTQVTTNTHSVKSDDGWDDAQTAADIALMTVATN